MDLNIAKMNAAISSYRLLYKNYRYANVYDTETYPWALTDITDILTTDGNDESVNENFSRFAVNVHPTAAGHRYMAQQIVAQIPQELGGQQAGYFFKAVIEQLGAYNLIKSVLRTVMDAPSKILSITPLAFNNSALHALRTLRA